MFYLHFFMMTAKLEIDVRGLLSHCEELANEDGNDWRLKKYIKSLNTMIQELDEQEEYVKFLCLGLLTFATKFLYCIAVNHRKSN